MKTKGISLIVLVITILVLAILAATVIISLSNTNILEQASDAVNKNNLQAVKEEVSLEVISNIAKNSGAYDRTGFEERLAQVGYEVTTTDSEKTIATKNGVVIHISNTGAISLADGTVVRGEPVTNPYDPDGWEFAWTANNGVWSDKITAGNVATGDIVAKLYSTGRNLEYGDYAGEPELEMVIEGNGEMPILCDIDTGVLFAWEDSEEWEVGRVSKLIICDGITNISASTAGEFSSLREVKISNSVTQIGEDAFCMCTGLSTITIPNSVTQIGEYTFSGCSSLSTVTIPNSITQIGKNAFFYCSSLSTITIPDSVTQIGEDAFAGCRSLSAITIPNSITQIGDWAFRGCSSLNAITIPDSVTQIGEWAFRECSSLNEINYGGTQQEWNEIEKDTRWNDRSSITKIKCSDGDITL